MKKSEMLKIITKAIANWTVIEHATYQEIAKDLLATIEEAGMLPPVNENNYHYMDNDSRVAVNAIAWYHCWQNESR